MMVRGTHGALAIAVSSTLTGESFALGDAGTPLPRDIPPMVLLAPTTGEFVRPVGTHPIEQTVGVARAFVRSIAEALPIRHEDELVVDELLAKAREGVGKRPLLRKSSGEK